MLKQHFNTEISFILYQQGRGSLYHIKFNYYVKNLEKKSVYMIIINKGSFFVIPQKQPEMVENGLKQLKMAKITKI